MPLITTIEEIKEHLVADATFDPKNVLPFIPAAKNEIIHVLGNSQYEELLDYYESNSEGISELDLLLPYVQKPLFYFAFLKGIDNFNVSIGANGIAVVSNSGLVPASDKRVQSLKDSIEALAYDSLEDLLLFLEENISDYPLWESSEAYAFQHQFLIYSARVFNEFITLPNARQTYIKWRSTMYEKELLFIVPNIGVEFLQELKDQIAANSLTESNKKVLPLLQRSLAYLTAAAFVDEKFHGNGLRFAVMAKKIMDANPTEYPTYAASSVYSETNASYTPIENDTNNKLVFFG